MIEAELKARLRNPNAVRTRLDSLATGEVETYRDMYFDVAGGRELRVREIESVSGVRCLLTYKEPSTHASGSKPEYETSMGSAAIAREILVRLGYARDIEITKRCVNYRFSVDGRDVVATVVTVPELDDTFIEVETVCDPSDLDAAIEIVRQVLSDLEVDEAEITDELYTDAVRSARACE